MKRTDTGDQRNTYPVQDTGKGKRLKRVYDERERDRGII